MLHNLAFRVAIAWIVLFSIIAAARAEEQRLLYVAAPGIRNYLQYGGAGILVFDIDHNHRFVKRISAPQSEKEQPENMKGICACAATRKLYFTTPTKLTCLDLVSERTLWEKAPPLGCDRMSILPDGSLLYVPSFENDTWNVIDGSTGEVVTTIETKSGAHNTVCSLDGKRMYLAGLKSPLLSIADTASHRVVKTAGPFAAAIRPFTVDAAGRRAFVCVNDLLGFEVGDLESGKVLARVEVQGFDKGPVERHGCPSHGIGMTPDEREIWICDGHNSQLHVFDVTATPPRQVTSIKVRQQPGWVTFSLDGRFAYSSTGEVMDTGDKRIVTALEDEKHREVHSEKVLEIHCADGMPVRVGNQFGVGRGK